MKKKYYCNEQYFVKRGNEWWNWKKNQLKKNKNILESTQLNPWLGSRDWNNFIKSNLKQIIQFYSQST